MPVTWEGTRNVAISSLQRFPGNARRGDVEAIRSSIRRFGQYRAIVVRDTGSALVVLAGNHTRDALEAEGHEDARCEVITCTDDEAARIALADNRLADLGGYDDRLLAELLASLDGDLLGTGWTPYDLEKLADGLAEPDFEPEDDSPRLDELEPRPCPKCGYDTANDPEGLK